MMGHILHDWTDQKTAHPKAYTPCRGGTLIYTIRSSTTIDPGTSSAADEPQHADRDLRRLRLHGSDCEAGEECGFGKLCRAPGGSDSMVVGSSSRRHLLEPVPAAQHLARARV